MSSPMAAGQLEDAPVIGVAAGRQEQVAGDGENDRPHRRLRRKSSADRPFEPGARDIMLMQQDADFRQALSVFAERAALCGGGDLSKMWRQRNSVVVSLP